MPEGPEIHQQADRIRRVVEGQVVDEVFFAFEHLRPWMPRLSGRPVERVRAHGKALLVHFENGPVVYSHNQLYGRWYVRKRDELPRTRRSLRFALHTETHSALLYSASTIEVLAPEDLATHAFLGKLGPDPLDPDVAWRDVLAQLDAPAHRGRQLATLLLDQSFVAGLGNYLRSEIMFAVRLAPETRPADLDRRTRGRLARAIVDLTRRSYETGGITRPPAEAARLKKQGLKRREYRHWVFGLGGRPCPACGTRIERIEKASRRVYLCPSCQV